MATQADSGTLSLVGAPCSDSANYRITKAAAASPAQTSHPLRRIQGDGGCYPGDDDGIKQLFIVSINNRWGGARQFKHHLAAFPGNTGANTPDYSEPCRRDVSTPPLPNSGFCAAPPSHTADISRLAAVSFFRARHLICHLLLRDNRSN